MGDRECAVLDKKYLFDRKEVSSRASGGDAEWKASAANTSRGAMRKGCQAPSPKSTVKTQKGWYAQLFYRRGRLKLGMQSWAALEKLGSSS